MFSAMMGVLIATSTSLAMACSEHDEAPNAVALAPLTSISCQLGEFTKKNTYALPGCPADVKDAINRMYQCGYWSGEEPYDAARKQEITNAMKSLRCSTFAADYHAAREKYAKDKAISRVLNEAIATDEVDF